MGIKTMDDNITILKAMGLYHWIVDGGFDGSLGGNMLTFERPPITANMNGQVDALQTDKYPLPLDAVGEYNAHAYFTTHGALQFAPGAKITSVTDFGTTNEDGTVEGDLHDVTIPWIMSNKPLSAFKSQNLEAHESDVEFGDAAKFCVFCAAAGNEGQALPTMAAASWWGIGAVEWRSGQWGVCSGSARSGDVDFVFPGAYYIPTIPGKAAYLNGTSFAAPAAAGTVKIIQHFFISKIGRPLTTDELYDFLKSCCLDLGLGGKDPQFGWGLPILPPYEDIDLAKWTETTTPSIPQPVPSESDTDALMKKNNPSEWAALAVRWAINKGLRGDANGILHLKETPTTEHMLTILYKLLNT